MTVFCYFYEGLRFSDIKTIINLYIIPKLTNIKEINNYIYDTLISIIGKEDFNMIINVIKFGNLKYLKEKF